MERSIRANRHELSQEVRNFLTIGLTAPLVGLVGTVSGFLNAFRGVALTGSGGIGAVSAGLAEALVPFAIGLGIGLVAIWSHAYLWGRVERITVRMTNTHDIQRRAVRPGSVSIYSARSTLSVGIPAKRLALRTRRRDFERLPMRSTPGPQRTERFHPQTEMTGPWQAVRVSSVRGRTLTT